MSPQQRTSKRIFQMEAHSMIMFALIVLLGITPLCFAVDTDFESETERDITGLYNQVKGIERELNDTKITLAQIKIHHHEDIDQRLRYLEAEAQKAEAALGIVKWFMGALFVCLPILLGVLAFYRKR